MDTTNNYELATWNRPRTADELLTFIANHHAALPDGEEIE